jgi:hypothetical protein
MFSFYTLLAVQLWNIQNLQAADERSRLQEDVMQLHYSNAEFMNC